MAKPIRLRPEAEAEAIEAREWYEERSEAAAVVGGVIVATYGFRQSQ